MAFINKNWLYLLGGLVLALLVWYFGQVVTYLLIAWVCSLLGQPIMRLFMDHIKIGRYRIGASWAALFTIFSFYGIFIGLLFLFVPTLVQQANNFAQIDYDALGNKLQAPFSIVDQEVHRLGILMPGESLSSKLQEAFFSWFKPSFVSDMLGTAFSTVGNVVVGIASVSFILYFFLEEKGLFARIVHALVPNHYEPKVLLAMEESSEALTAYFKGLLLQLAAFSLMTTVALWLFGIPNALLIGVAGGMLNVIPYVGPIIGLVLGWFITLSSGLMLEIDQLGWQLVKVAVAFLGVQVIDNLFLSTIIFSKSVKAHPLEIFVVTLMAAEVGGVVGMVVGIPVYTVSRVVARIFFSQLKVVQRLTEHLEEEE
jgi:predicted PurR-regulated permease PerM